MPKKIDIVNELDDIIVELEDVATDTLQLLQQLQQLQSVVAEAETGEVDKRGLLVSNPLRF